nr:hypothetical protein Iba_chr05aCG9310 [Ipomoea batatas]
MAIFSSPVDASSFDSVAGPFQHRGGIGLLRGATVVAGSSSPISDVNGGVSWVSPPFLVGVRQCVADEGWRWRHSISSFRRSAVGRSTGQVAFRHGLGLRVLPPPPMPINQEDSDDDNKLPLTQFMKKPKPPAPEPFVPEPLADVPKEDNPDDSSDSSSSSDSDDRNDANQEAKPNHPHDESEDSPMDERTDTHDESRGLSAEVPQDEFRPTPCER